MKVRCLAFALVMIADVTLAGTPWKKLASDGTREVNEQTITVQHHGAVEVGFGPHEGAEKLVLKVIDSARSEIHVLAYAFTSAPVTGALLDARRRGVEVALVVDYEQNLVKDRSGKAVHALSALVNAGCRVRTISAFPIFHDKTVIADRESVETGSFNYSDAASNRNSENVIVLWKNPELAKVYLNHWELVVASLFRIRIDADDSLTTGAVVFGDGRTF